MGSQLPTAAVNPPRVRVRDATVYTKVVIWEQPTVAAQAVGCCGTCSEQSRLIVGQVATHSERIECIAETVLISWQTREQVVNVVESLSEKVWCPVPLQANSSEVRGEHAQRACSIVAEARPCPPPSTLPILTGGPGPNPFTLTVLTVRRVVW